MQTIVHGGYNDFSHAMLADQLLPVLQFYSAADLKWAQCRGKGLERLERQHMLQRRNAGWLGAAYQEALVVGHIHCRLTGGWQILNSLYLHLTCGSGGTKQHTGHTCMSVGEQGRLCK